MRLGRRDYWIRAIGVYVGLFAMFLVAALGIYVGFETNSIRFIPMPIINLVFYAVVLLTLIIGTIHTVWMVQRFRDVGANPWLLLIHFIPFGWVGILIILLLPTGQMADGGEVEDVGSEY